VKKINWPKLIFAIVLCQLAGIIGSVFTVNSIPTWYATLVKPTFNPPSWVFGPVWTILYTLMGISLYLVMNKVAAYLLIPYLIWGSFATFLTYGIWTLNR